VILTLPCFSNPVGPQPDNSATPAVAVTFVAGAVIVIFTDSSKQSTLS
jgi:hypothetical protein